MKRKNIVNTTQILPFSPYLLNNLLFLTNLKIYSLTSFPAKKTLDIEILKLTLRDVVDSVGCKAWQFHREASTL